MSMPCIVTKSGPHFFDVERNGQLESVITSGFHAFFAAEVPFIPASALETMVRTVDRHVTFVTSLASCNNVAPDRVAFDLRLISNPATASVRVVLLGKAFDSSSSAAERLARQLWSRFETAFPHEPPFLYPLDPITDDRVLNDLLAPVSVASSCMLELRKAASSYGPATTAVAVTHRLAREDSTRTMATFMQKLAESKQRCTVSVCLRPSLLHTAERSGLAGLKKRIEYRLAHSYGARRTELDTLSRLQDDALNELIGNERNLLLLKVQIIGDRQSPTDVADALVHEFDSGGLVQRPVIRPVGPHDLHAAKTNFELLEHHRWGENAAAHGNSRLRRLSWLVSPSEAALVFRLPTPTASGTLTGIEVRSVAVSAPGVLTPSHTPSVQFGSIINAGRSTGRSYGVTLEDINRHVLIAGATGSGKSTTSRALLSELWRRHRIPFLVLYPLDTGDYRSLAHDADLKDHLLIYTIGDRDTSPFRFNPFTVPTGCLVEKHINNLHQCFVVAFNLDSPAPEIIGQALRRLYSQAGYGPDLSAARGGTGGVPTPNLDDFQAVLAVDVKALDYGREQQKTIAQALMLRINNLIAATGQVMNVSGSTERPIAELLRRPVVIELDALGSREAKSLVMHFLLVQLMEELSVRPQSERGTGLKHVTVVEEAHMLMSAAHERGTAELLSSILAEVRGYGEGMMIVDQMPAALSRSAIGNTNTKLMHNLHDPNSFDLLAANLNLDSAQTIVARGLQPGQLLTRDPRYAALVHVQVPSPPNTARLDNPGVRRHMESIPPQQRILLPESRHVAAAPGPAHRHSIICLDNPKSCDQWDSVKAVSSQDLGRDRRKIIAASEQKDWRAVQTICRAGVGSSSASEFAAYGYLYRISHQTQSGVEMCDLHPVLKEALTALHAMIIRDLSMSL